MSSLARSLGKLVCVRAEVVKLTMNSLTGNLCWKVYWHLTMCGVPKALWDWDGPDVLILPGDKYSIEMNPDDPANAPQRWFKEDTGGLHFVGHVKWRKVRSESLLGVFQEGKEISHGLFDWGKLMCCEWPRLSLFCLTWSGMQTHAVVQFEISGSFERASKLETF